MKRHEMMLELGRNARAAAHNLAMADTQAKNKALAEAAQQLRGRADIIIAANQADMEIARNENLPKARLDRILLDANRLEGIAQALEAIINLPDPVGAEMARWTADNQLDISRVRVPLGVIGVIYESRPNVTADAAALCLKSGNVVILRGSSEIQNSAKAIADCFTPALEGAGINPHAVQLVPSPERENVGDMLAGLDGNIDVIVPRGGKGLTGRVQDESRVPVFAHLDGICHSYVDAAADIAMAVEIVVNAKMRRTGICGTTETLLVDKACAATHLPELVNALRDAGCEIRGDADTQAIIADIIPATEEDWATEYLDEIISVAQVDGVGGAIAHINHYSSNHTDAIITNDEAAAARFLREVDSAIVMHNSSTQFADGGEFGMGAEIGIATGRFHARGPVGLEQLTTFKYMVRGQGQTRPL